jgi:hypothetical protein
MRHAYLIDPFARSVTCINLVTPVDGPLQLAEIYALLRCTDIEAVYPHKSGNDVLLLDELGKIRNIEKAYFQCRLYSYATLVGRALWVGRTRDGSITDPSCSLDYVEAHVMWALTKPPVVSL